MGETESVRVIPAASVTGHIVVDTTMVSVVTEVVLERAGQSGIVDGHAVIVAVRVERTADVVHCSMEESVTGAADKDVERLIWGSLVQTVVGAGTALDVL